jgi:hypothetical protein
MLHGKRHPQDTDAEVVAQFLICLVTERQVSASTENQVESKLLFQYSKLFKQDLP